MTIKFKDRPICVCGCKMKLIKYKGYYESFNYWACDNCKEDLEKKECDSEWNGNYS